MRGKARAGGRAACMARRVWVGRDLPLGLCTAGFRASHGTVRRGPGSGAVFLRSGSLGILCTESLVY